MPLTRTESIAKLNLYKVVIVAIEEFILMEKQAKTLPSFVVVVNQYAKPHRVKYTPADVLSTGLGEVIAGIVKEPFENHHENA